MRQRRRGHRHGPHGIQGCRHIPAARPKAAALLQAAGGAPGASLSGRLRRVGPHPFPAWAPAPSGGQRAQTLCGVRACCGLPPPAAVGLRFLRSPAFAPPPPGGVPPAAAGRAARPLPRSRAGPPPRLALAPGPVRRGLRPCAACRPVGSGCAPPPPVSGAGGSSPRPLWGRSAPRPGGLRGLPFRLPPWGGLWPPGAFSPWAWVLCLRRGLLLGRAARASLRSPWRAAAAVVVGFSPAPPRPAAPAGGSGVRVASSLGPPPRPAGSPVLSDLSDRTALTFPSICVILFLRGSSRSFGGCSVRGIHGQRIKSGRKTGLFFCPFCGRLLR